MRRPIIRLLTIGPPTSGKTTLLQALARREEQTKPSHTRFSSELFLYSLREPAQEDTLRDLAQKAALLDGLLLVCHAAAPLPPETLIQLRFARAASVPVWALLLTGCDALSEAALDEIEQQTRYLLSELGFSSDDLLYLRASLPALEKSAEALVRMLEGFTKSKAPVEARPLRMSVLSWDEEQPGPGPREAKVRLLQGILRIDEEVEIVGYFATSTARILTIQRDDAEVEEVAAPATLTCTVTGSFPNGLLRGQAIAAPKTLQSATYAKAQLYASPEQVRWLSAPLGSEERLLIWREECPQEPARVTLLTQQGLLHSRAQGPARLVFPKVFSKDDGVLIRTFAAEAKGFGPPLTPGMSFTWKQNGVYGGGVITAVEPTE